jgi:hypothetical protein
MVEPDILLQFEPIFYEIEEETRNTVSLLRDNLYLPHNDKYIQARFDNEDYRDLTGQLRDKCAASLGRLKVNNAQLMQNTVNELRQYLTEFSVEFDKEFDAKHNPKHRNYTVQRMEKAIFANVTEQNEIRIRLQRSKRTEYYDRLYNNFKEFLFKVDTPQPSQQSTPSNVTPIRRPSSGSSSSDPSDNERDPQDKIPISGNKGILQLNYTTGPQVQQPPTPVVVPNPTGDIITNLTPEKPIIDVKPLVDKTKQMVVEDMIVVQPPVNNASLIRQTKLLSLIHI